MLMLVALSIFMIGAMGLAIDGSQLYAQRQMAQAAADAAAQAAAMSIFGGTNTTSTNPFASDGSFTCAVPPAALDRRTPCVYAQYNGFGTNADAVTVNVTSSPGLASNISATTTVTVQRTLATGLIRILGPASSIIKATAVAAVLTSVPSSCVYVLDPAAKDAFIANNGATVTADCGISINSSNAEAAIVQGGATVNAAMSIVGGFTKNNGGAILPSDPTVGVPAAGDPFASVTAPSAGACDHTNYSPGWGTFTLNPGTYCGGITINNGATATFNPGTYIVNGGGVNFGGGAHVSGAGLMFYMTGSATYPYASAVMDNGTTVTLSAQTSGQYMGLLFYQDRTVVSNSTATFAGGANMDLTGSLYFPTTNISYTNGASPVGFSTALIAKQVLFAGGVRMKFDPTGGQTGLVKKSVALYQ